MGSFAKTTLQILALLGLAGSCLPAARDDAGTGERDAERRDLDASRDARADGSGARDSAGLDTQITLDAALADRHFFVDASVPDSFAADRFESVDSRITESGARFDAEPGSPDAGARPDAAARADAAPLWPLDASVPTACSNPAPDLGGSGWAGWANVQWPQEVGPAQAGDGALVEGALSEAIYGQVYQAGVTEAPGAATGFEAQLLVGPYGSSPLLAGHCFTAQTSSYNSACDTPQDPCGNNDEYVLQVNAPSAGLYGLFYRYRPAGGAWLYGDLDGSDNGLQIEQAALMPVDGARQGRLVVVTLNLRCRTDSWDQRLPLVVRALARVDPDLVAFEEDCTDASAVSQSWQIRQELSRFTRRGYQILRSQTHVANHPEGSFGEGLSILSAHKIRAQQIIDLPPTPVVAPAHFQRRALVVDLDVAGRPLRFVAAHLEFGGDNEGTRDAQAQALLGLRAAQGETVIAGDLNATPDEAAVQRLNAALADLWAAQTTDPGLSMPASAPGRRIDYLFGSGSLVPALHGARMMGEHSGAVWLSDHRGVAVVLLWP